MPGTVQIALCIILSHYSIQCDSVRGTIIPFYQRGSWGPPRISESHKGTLHSWSESEIWFKVRSTQLQSLDFSHWTYASYLASHLFLLGLLYCWKSSYLFKKTIHSTSARTMLSISFEHAWHRTGSWVDAQKIFIECMTALKKKLCKSKKPSTLEHLKQANCGQNCSSNDLYLDTLPFQEVLPCFFNHSWFIRPRIGLEK